MSNITYDYMEEYIRGLIKDEDDLLIELEEFAKENSVPIIHKEVGRFLEVLINIKKPKKILELGTAIGYSAILMEKASQGESSITTIERDKAMVDLATKNIEKSGYKEKIKIVEGDCLEVLSEIDEKFDLIFMDAGKGHYNHFFPECLRLLEDDGIIIGDNVLFRGMVASDHLVKRRKITIVKRMREFLNMVSQDEFLTSIIPMGDGLALITRRNK
ncbi:O-methyltransferase [Clostridium cochlearium]|uniref:tRNA 5-hydroxyuridine methyltransferase n=1 Tax=Clostridium cochlearium TaxID=1494 RepID=A0A239ZS90_CLOCO|nr:O-methyltransferase [Clostridium cochlearium]MBV1816932.1 O-methyltransferase [Bacteroidales bacterium MSK.15.36]NSJ90726.1 O-methyltransferase [Coprococcus sp. MSK.21.13]MBE6064176.1 O-methyltransferase [Clostridium cochlearium]MBU5269373.1 O-methyltransferase [Clostridium cochlearium]MCG4571068.1 O-methyltransferase [Clostridium cochlearium]